MHNGKYSTILGQNVSGYITKIKKYGKKLFFVPIVLNIMHFLNKIM